MKNIRRPYHCENYTYNTEKSISSLKSQIGTGVPIQGVQKFPRIVGHVDLLQLAVQKKIFFELAASRNCAPLLVLEYGGRTARRERKRKRQAEDIVEVQRRQIPRPTKWPILSPSSTFYSGVFATLARLDQQNSVCLVTLAQARLKARIDLKVSSSFSSYLLPVSDQNEF